MPVPTTLATKVGQVQLSARLITTERCKEMEKRLAKLRERGILIGDHGPLKALRLGVRVPEGWAYSLVVQSSEIGSWRSFPPIATLDAYELKSLADAKDDGRCRSATDFTID